MCLIEYLITSLTEFVFDFFNIYSNEYFFSRVAHITNTSLTNIKGEKKSVIHLADDMEPIYQYIPHAYCV